MKWKSKWSKKDAQVLGTFYWVDSGNLFSRKEELSSGLELLEQLWALSSSEVALEYQKYSVFPLKVSVKQYFG